MEGSEGGRAALWRHYAELGLLGVPFDEKHGGINGGPVDPMIVREAVGRARALEPYFASVILGGGFVRLGGNDKLKDDILPKVAGGEMRLAFAHSERQSRYDLADVAVTARKDGTDYVLDGAKSLVVHGDSADQLVVS